MQAATLSSLEKEGYQRLNKDYLINRLQILGSGSYGTVYKGYDLFHSRFIAIKHVPRKVQLASGSHQREITVMEKLNHPNIMKFYGYEGGGNCPDGLFMFLELCECGTLKECITNQLTQREAMKMFEQLVEGMAYIHEQKIFHRDLKPDNILVTAKGDVKIADFGTARNIDEQLEKTFQRCTPAYSAPEVYLDGEYKKREGKYDQKCDVFSAGYILYEMLTSEQLNKAVSTHQGLKSFLQICKIKGGFEFDHPSLTPRWKDLLSGMLSFRPEERPSFPQIRNSLKDFGEGVDRKSVLRPCPPEEQGRSKEIVAVFKKVVQKEIGLANYFVTPLRAFQATQKEQTKLVPKVFKLTLIYYSLLMYYKRADEGIRKIGSRETIELPGYKMKFGELEFSLTVHHRQEVSDFSQQQLMRVNQGKEQTKDFLKAKIIAQLQAILMLDQTNLQHIILQQLHITQKALDDFKRHNQAEFQTTYSNSFKRLVSNLYQTNAQLQVLSQADLQVYLALLYTSQLCKYGTEKLPPSFQAISSMSKEVLIKNIVKVREE